jgi:hypothetical protein
MWTLDLGEARLTWTPKRAKLEKGGSRLEFVPSESQLKAGPLAESRHRAIVATRGEAILADGKAFTLTSTLFVQEILGAALIGDAAGLYGRERVEVVAFATGALLGSAEPGGEARPEMTIVIPEFGFAVAFHDRLVVARADGLVRRFQLQAAFPLLQRIGNRFLAAGRDRMVLIAAENPEVAEVKKSQGAIRHDLVRSSGTLGGVPSRDRIYIVDAAKGRIHERAVQGEIQSCEVKGGLVHIRSGGNRKYAFTADGTGV